MSLKNTDFKKELDILFKAILKLENEDECYRFFEDIATINELKSLAQIQIRMTKLPQLP